MNSQFKTSLPIEETRISHSISQSFFCAAKRHLKAGSRFFAVAAIMIAGLLITPIQTKGQTPWTLSREQRQSYLNYYAPVILKRGDENNGKTGRDWITNFDFDRDGDFSNNRLNWLNINQYVDASVNGPSYYDRWRIRPTLYTSLIEYMEGGGKSLVLLYHVYNAADKDGSQIHDWERVEIVVHGVGGTPGGAGEYVNHSTITMHKAHHIRRSYDADLQFMQTATGRHVLLWQADEGGFELTNFTATYGHELHFVTNSYPWIASQVASSVNRAEVNITLKDEKKNVHYVFAPEGSQAAVDAWAAKPLSYTTASNSASRVDNGDTVAWSRVKRLTYELQDMSDIFPTHWQSNPWYVSWLSGVMEDILLESPIINEWGQPEVSAGMQRFYTQSRDAGSSNLTDGREGILSKNWFYGAYSADLSEGKSDFKGYEGLGLDSYGLSRGAASGYYNSHGSFWWQHDYFVHSGAIDTADTRESGIWLTGAWYTAASGGYDGRWEQLFDDRPGYEPSSPLDWSIAYPTNQCTDTFLVTAKASGGQSPYTFYWQNASPISGANDPSNQAYVFAYSEATVTVQSADGQTRSANIYLTPYCRNGEQLP